MQSKRAKDSDSIATVGSLRHVLVLQHFLDLSFFHILFSDGKSSGSQAYGAVLPGINSVSDEVRLFHIIRATAEYISVLINGRC